MLTITHDGIFHADEVTAEAELLKWNKLSKIIIISEEEFITSSEEERNNWIKSNNILYIIRTRNQEIISWGLKNPNVYMLDVGRVYDYPKLNFDHHQDNDSDASNLLIFEYLYNIGKLTDFIYLHFYSFMEGISDFDINRDSIHDKWWEFNNKNKYRNLSNIISGFNRNPRNEKLQNEQFKKAVEFAIQILENEIITSNIKLDFEMIFMNRDYLPNRVVILDEYCPNYIWEKYEDYAIMPQKKGWYLIASNYRKKIIPEINHKDLILKTSYIAVFKTKEAVIEIAKKF